MAELSINFYRMPATFRDTVTRKDLKEILLNTNGWILACGYSWNIRSKHIGAGVYELHLEKRNG